MRLRPAQKSLREEKLYIMNNEMITGGVFAAAGGVLAYLFGPWDAPIMVLLGVVTMDYLTGVACAAVAKELCSTVGFKGLLKKVTRNRKDIRSGEIPDTCLYEDADHVTYSKNETVLFSYEERNVHQSHDYISSLRLFGKTCADGFERT